MKKTIVLLIILSIVSMTAFSSADTIFKLRNNVEFGMTLSEVEALETLPVIKPLAHSYGYGKIANIYNSHVQYHFKNEKLQEVEFNFGVDGNIINDYGDISSLLQSKYGDPIGNKGGTSAVLRGREFDGFISFLYDNIIDYEEWLIQVDGGYVKIDHFIAKGSKDKYHILSYSFFTNSEVAALADDI